MVLCLLRLSKNYEKTSANEQQGVCAGDKKSPARSIKQVFQTFRESLKNRTAGQKHFFDTLHKQRTIRSSACFPGTLCLRKKDFPDILSVFLYNNRKIRQKEILS